MAIEIIDDEEYNIYPKLFRDEDGYDWNIMVRPSGSISLYATNTGYCAHGVVWDSLDTHRPTNVTSDAVVARLAEMAEGINALLAKYPARKAA